MPNKNTFSIKAIKDLIIKHVKTNDVVIDPFANEMLIEKDLRNKEIKYISNDLDTKYNTTFNLEAVYFLKTLYDKSVDIVLYDPPYSPRQIKECYNSLNLSINFETTQSSYWSKQKKEISRIVKPGGKVITCGWNSGGIGKKYGFEMIEILLIAHGGQHNDTIVTVERRKE